jgi:hypothetical protein
MRLGGGPCPPCAALGDDLAAVPALRFDPTVFAAARAEGPLVNKRL